MDSSVFHQLITSFHKAEKTLNNGSFGTLEENSTKALNALKDIETKLQFIRVKAYLKYEGFSTAHVIAQSIQRTPSYKQESIQVVNTLMKGKRYLDVIEMCNIFKPATGDQGQLEVKGEYAEIVELRQKAMAELEEDHQVDAMTRLPHEIMTLILNQLGFSDILNCVQVSKFWRQIICDSSATSRQNIILDYITTSFPSEFYKSSISLLSDGAKSLGICGPFEENTKMELLDMLTNVSFNNLRVLTIGNVKNTFVTVLYVYKSKVILSWNLFVE